MDVDEGFNKTCQEVFHCHAKARHDGRQGASAKSLLACCIHLYARVMSNFFSMKMRLQDTQNNDITNLKKLLTNVHVAIKFEDKIRIIGHSAFSVVLSFHCRQSDEKIILPW